MKQFAILVCLVALMACVPRSVLKTTQLKMPTDNGFFIPAIDPICPSGCYSLRLDIHNTSSEDIEINWNKTLFIQNGKTNGTFMYEGVIFKDRNLSKPNDIVFANSYFSKQIWPSNLVYYKKGKYGGWDHKALDLGENGVYLTVNVGDQVIHEKISVNITREIIPE